MLEKILAIKRGNGFQASVPLSSIMGLNTEIERRLPMNACAIRLLALDDR